MTQMLPRLNLDILVNVINVIENPCQIVRSFMYLNRYFYHEGAKVALQRPIMLDGLDELELFLRFVKAEKWTRCRYLRHLCYAVDESDRCGNIYVPLVAKFITRCTKLETLRLGSGGALFFDNKVWDACAMLSSLRNLDIYVYSSLCVSELLQGLKSTLSNVRLRIEEAHEEFQLDLDDDPTLNRLHPITLFANHRDTLESLICEQWYGAELMPTASHVYPKLLRLAIDYVIVRDVARLVRAYPNLRYLRSSTARRHDIVGDEEKRQIRGENLNSQTGAGRTSWPCLQAFSGGIDELYILGLPGRIRRIEFQTVRAGCVLEGNALRNEMLEEVLAHAQPEHLRLECNDVLLGDARSGLIAALRGAGGESLRSLYVEARLVSEDCDYHQIFTELATSLHSTRLAVLDLDVRLGKTDHVLPVNPISSSEDESWSDGERERRKRIHELRRRSPPPPPSTDAEESTTRIDPDEYLRDLWETMPTLDEAVMRIQNPRRGRHNMGFRKATVLRGTARREDWPNEWATIPSVPNWRWGW
ncbi:uncharacterized protein BXZ73DRAFT_81249 [Epithele typhae]|uniref:uncharacterized protein n=1 Tax=Epithele typhae TaxID=378194 RepID=UPI002007F5DD|nr:uncharacterized protein BXZ73DRAFT_81249 [Epithele typhae]KAH9915775.1 hypothetical protein BXZ73DRAFT_81249 [Epithele typhae]